MGWIVAAPVVFVALAVPSWAFAQTPVQGSSRVRGMDPAIVEAIEQASLQSPTFNQLVTAITATDGIVYVHYGECQRHNVRSCLVLAVTQAGPNRILHIRIDPRRTGHRLMVAIGHELKHALELLNEPTAVNLYTAHNFFQRIAPRRGLAFETQAAIEIGLKIDRELRRWAKSQ
jgi:hypothetical protein